MSITPADGQNTPSQNSTHRRFGCAGCLGIVCIVIIALICLSVIIDSLSKTTQPTSTTKVPEVTTTGDVVTNATKDTTGNEHADKEPEKVYTVEEIDHAKNSIPTGTELAVQGLVYDRVIKPSLEDCGRLVMQGRIPVQHGEADPASYCRFSVLLTEKNAAGNDAWPGVGLMCDIDPSEWKSSASNYPYGTQVEVRGTYAASLDFQIAYVPGFHFGVPVLEGCTFSLIAPSKTPTPHVQIKGYSY